MEGLMGELDIAEEDLVAVDKEMRFLWFYWVGCFGMFPALVATILIMGERLDELALGSEQAVNILTSIFLAASMAVIALSVWIRKKLLSGGWLFLTDAAVKQAKPGQAEWLVRFRMGMILCTALSGAAGLMGFMLCLFSGNMLLFGLFMVLGAGGTIYHRPRREELIEYYHRFRGNIDCP
jgi:hypothetical protein